MNDPLGELARQALLSEPTEPANRSAPHPPLTAYDTTGSTVKVTSILTET